MGKRNMHAKEGRKNKEVKKKSNEWNEEGRKEGRKEQRNLEIPRIKLLIAPTTNDVKTARPLSHRYDIL